MTKKTKGILFVAGTLLVVAMPIIYKKAEIPQETTNTLIAFVMGMISQMGIHKAQQVAKAKKDDKNDNRVS